MQTAIEFFVWMTDICALFLIAGAFAAIGEKIETMIYGDEEK